MKTTALTLPQAFLSLGSSILIDAAARKAIATDGEAIVIHPLPEEFTATRLIGIHPDMPPITPDSGDPTADTYDLAALEHPPVYRITLNAAKLAQLAEAMQNDVVILELPADPAGKPIKVLPWDGVKHAFLMPRGTPPGVKDGLLVETGTGKSRKTSEPKPEAELPPPVVTASVQRGTLEIFFGGKPADEIREALKDPRLGFRYSGRGTKRGVPPNAWYGPDNPHTRHVIGDLLKVTVAAAA
jgi:hypothetical protein